MGRNGSANHSLTTVLSCPHCWLLLEKHIFLELQVIFLRAPHSGCGVSWLTHRPLPSFVPPAQVLPPHLSVDGISAQKRWGELSVVSSRCLFSDSVKLCTSSDVSKIEGTIGDKVSMAIMNVSRAVAGLIIGFIYSWRISLVILSVSPVLAVTAVAVFKVSPELKYVLCFFSEK